MKSEFISVELVLHTDCDPSEWITWAEGQDNHVTKNPGSDTKWHVFFAPLPSADADSTIRNLCAVIDQLPPIVKAQWDSAVRREFYVGYQAGADWPCFTDLLSLDTITRIATHKADLRLTIYPVSSE